MILGKKVRLKPTEEQEHQLWKSAGTARWALSFEQSAGINLDVNDILFFDFIISIRYQFGKN